MPTASPTPGIPEEEGDDSQDSGESADGQPQPQVFGAIPSGDDGTTTTGTDTATPVETGLQIDDEKIISIEGSGYPGFGTRNQTQVRNTRDDGGTLSITAFSFTSSENGITEPEAGVGDTGPRGELHTNVKANIYIEYPNGSVRYLAGGPETRYTIATLAGEEVFNATNLPAESSAAFVVDWVIPRSANNTIQSDAVTFDIELNLRGGE
jgi:hypothetical protein